MKKAKVLVTFAAMIAAGGLAACGSSQTDKDYKALNQPGAPSAADAMKNAASQVTPIPGQNISIKADGATGVSVHPGKSITITGTAQVLIATPFSTVLKDAPSDAKFQVSDVGGIQHWSITYKAPVAGAQLKPMHVVIQLGPTDDANTRLLAADIANGKQSLEITITVVKDSTTPLINIAGLDSANPVEGLVVPFTVVVNDPSSVVSAQAPTLSIAADTADLNLAGAVDVNPFIAADASKPAQNMGDGQWTFFYTYNTVGKTLPRPKQHSSVGSDQGIAVFKVTMTTSDEQSVSKAEKFNVKFDTQKQLPQFAPIKDASQLTVTLGKLNQIDVQVSSLDPKSVLKLDATATHAALKLLSGQAQAKCNAATAEGMLCHVRWTPKCDAAVDKTETVQIKVINTVGGISAEAPWTSPDLKLIKPDNCGAKVTKKPTVKGAKTAAGTKAAIGKAPALTAKSGAGPISAPVPSNEPTGSSGGHS